MKAIVGFGEITGYVRDRYGVTLSLETLSEREVKVTVTKRIVFNIDVSVELEVENVGPAEVTLGYDGNFGVDMIIGGALKFIKAKIPEIGEALQTGSDQTATLDLTKISKAKSLTDSMNLRAIRFHSDSIELEAELK